MGIIRLSLGDGRAGLEYPKFYNVYDRDDRHCWDYFHISVHARY